MERPLKQGCCYNYQNKAPPLPGPLSVAHTTAVSIGLSVTLSGGEEVMKTKLMQFLRNEEGLTTVEYAIAGGLVGLAVVLAFQALGLEVSRIIEEITAILSLA